MKVCLPQMADGSVRNLWSIASFLFDATTLPQGSDGRPPHPRFSELVAAVLAQNYHLYMLFYLKSEKYPEVYAIKFLFKIWGIRV